MHEPILQDGLSLLDQCRRLFISGENASSQPQQPAQMFCVNPPLTGALLVHRVALKFTTSLRLRKSKGTIETFFAKWKMTKINTVAAPMKFRLCVIFSNSFYFHAKDLRLLMDNGAVSVSTWCLRIRTLL